MRLVVGTMERILCFVFFFFFFGIQFRTFSSFNACVEKTDDRTFCSSKMTFIGFQYTLIWFWNCVYVNHYCHHWFDDFYYGATFPIIQHRPNNFLFSVGGAIAQIVCVFMMQHFEGETLELFLVGAHITSWCMDLVSSKKFLIILQSIFYQSYMKK